MVMGAPGDDDNGGSSGSAYVFVRSGAGTWTERAKLLASDGAGNDQLGTSVALYGDGGTALVGAIRDDDTGLDSGSVYVFELPPDLDGPITSNVIANPYPASADQSVLLTAHIDDADTGGSSIASADFEIRHADSTVVLSGSGSGTCTDSQLLCPDDTEFDQVDEDVVVTIDPGDLPAGIFDACVRGTDALGNVGEFDCNFLTVFDPSAGFVSGGGWMSSPEGAYAPDPSLVGEATIGFVAKYQKGASSPTGQTEFQFKPARLNFHSTSYDWLIVSGATAQFQGTGTINGAGNYGFLVTAIDSQTPGRGSLDRLQIKIWDKNNGGSVVYDNQLEPDDKGQELVGGNIVVHK